MGAYDSFFVEWDDRYSVGVRAIDRQHLFLIRRIRDLQEAMAAGSAAAMLAPLIHDLVTYTKFHFAYEERLYEERGYEDIQHHREFHSDMARQVTEMEDAVKNNRLHARAPVMAFLKHWLVDHILGEDMAAFRKQQPAQDEGGFESQPLKTASDTEETVLPAEEPGATPVL
jgi:hemerythrin-like metal-binding protein